MRPAPGGGTAVGGAPGRWPEPASDETDGGRAAALRGWLADSSFVPVEARERGILKLWFGASPRVHAPVQAEEHRRTLGEYEELAEGVGELLTRGQREALEFGIRYERMMVDFWQWVETREP
ncbi:hypothetical protein R1T08_07730 [Streptomyces sp. SBC-4]|nr:hypothetical protein [Streptomyces sp. SBC-4]MDV5144146.1 hypothetical protein [Streptomyces sp. SBC-4]